MTITKLRRCKRIIRRSSYYEDRIEVMANMVGYWTMKQIVFLHEYRHKKWLYAMKQVARYTSKMAWYIRKLEGHWNESLDYES